MFLFLSDHAYALDVNDLTIHACCGQKSPD